MATAKYDAFIARVLRQVRVEFAFITPDYPHELPVDLVWVLVSALMVEKYVSMKEAAQIVHDFCVRRGNEIPVIMNSVGINADETADAKAWREIH
jgi:hypothetical protein